MYKVGDWIIYGKAGVCHVAEIRTIDFPCTDDGQLYYVLKPLSQNYTISTPVTNTKVFTRPVISKREAERLIDGIPQLEVRTYHSRSAQELAEHYKRYVLTYDVGDLIELTMSLHAKRHPAGDGKGKFGAIDQKFMKQAEELLFGELSVALGIPKEAVPEYIASRVDSRGRREEER